MVTVIKKTDTKRQIKRKVKPNGYSSQKKLFDAKKYNGILKLKEDPLEIQRKMREE
jgi:S-adenosylmethionine synthetase